MDTTDIGNPYELRLPNFNAKELLVHSLEVVAELGWDIESFTPTGMTAVVPLSAFSRREVVTITVHNGVATIKSESPRLQIVDWGSNKDNIRDFVSTFHERKHLYSHKELAQKYDELVAQASSSTESFITPKTTLRDYMTFFIPRQEYFITPIILNLNIAIFIIMACNGMNIIHPDTKTLLAWGANFSPKTLTGEWWRIITSCFLHIGIHHLLMNMYALFYIGLLAESLVGRLRFAVAYILCGILGAMASLWWNEPIVSAGASGAIFGTYGLVLAMFSFKSTFITPSDRQPLLASILFFVGFNLLYGLKGGIDNAAHIGGLISGLAIGYTFYPTIRSENARLKYGTVTIVTLVVMSLSAYAYSAIPHDVFTYDAKIEEFYVNQKNAMSIRTIENSPKVKVLEDIKNIALYNWKKNNELVSELDKLKLPDDTRKRNEKLIEFSNLKIRYLSLYYKILAENTTAYNDSLKYYQHSLEQLVKELPE